MESGGTVSPRLGLGMCGTLTLDIWAWCASPRISYPWSSYPSTRSKCHTVCEIKASITLFVYDDVLLKSKRTTGALGKRPKSKVNLNKDFCTTGGIKIK